MIARRFPALAALALVGLASCTSQPSTRTVVEEIIETLDGVSQDVKDCLSERLEENYTDDDLEAIGEANPNFNSASPDMPTTPELDAFIEDLATCRNAEPTDDTATDDTATDDTVSGEPSDETTATTEA